MYIVCFLELYQYNILRIYKNRFDHGYNLYKKNEKIQKVGIVGGV